MMKFRQGSMLAFAVVLGLASLASPVEAGIRLSANGSVVATSPTDSLLYSGSVAGYDILLNSTLTNFSDPGVLGTLVTATSYSTGDGPVGPLTILAEVIDGGAVGSPLGIFAGFAGPGVLLTNLTGNGSSGSVIGTSTANATTATAGPIPIADLDEVIETVPLSATSGYTLTNTTHVVGVATHQTSQGVTVRSEVRGVPEPGAIALLGAVPFVVGYVIRRRRA